MGARRSFAPPCGLSGRLQRTDVQDHLPSIVARESASAYDGIVSAPLVTTSKSLCVGHVLESDRADSGGGGGKPCWTTRPTPLRVGPVARLAKVGEHHRAALDGRAGRRPKTDWSVGDASLAGGSPRGIVPGTGARSVMPSAKFGFASNALYRAVRAMSGKYSKLGRVTAAARPRRNVEADRDHQRRRRDRRSAYGDPSEVRLLDRRRPRETGRRSASMAARSNAEPRLARARARSDRR